MNNPKDFQEEIEFKSVEEQVSHLKSQIDDYKYDVYVDEYPMALRELITMYEEGDINLKAQYQRVFKWNDEQRTKFIESLFLSLPIPPIFLYQDEDALWEVVDGIQRLSTIFQFVGVLKDEKGKNMPYLTLTSCPKLTSLNGLNYNSLSKDLIREFKKFKLNLIIISKKSKKDIKLEVFRRLNGYGTKLNAQELRNALTLLMDPDYFEFVEELSANENFLKCIGLDKETLKNKKNDDSIKNKKHYEYVVRYCILREKFLLLSYKAKSNTKIDELFDDTFPIIVEKKLINIYTEKRIFNRVFTLLNKTLGNDSFKKYSEKDNKFKDRIRESSFEAIIPGLAINIDYYESHEEELIEKIKRIYDSESTYNAVLSPNPRAIDRMKKLVVESEEIFKIDE